MKKITIIGIAVAMTMGFISCKKENLAQEETSGNLIKETFSAGFVQKDTRTTISDDAATVQWKAGDKVYYFTKDDGDVRNYTINAAGEKATLVLERESGDTYFNLVYAGNTDPTFMIVTGNSMVFDGVKSAQNGTFQSANVSVGRTVPGGTGITFKPVVSLVKFTTARTDIKTIVLTGGNGEMVAGYVDVDPTAAAPKAVYHSGGSTSITVTIDTPAAGTYYIGVIPGEYLNGLNLLLKDSNGAAIGTVTATNSTNLTAGDAMINYGDVDSHVSDLPVLLTGKFTVGATKQVQFTRGNLFWNGSAWRLEAEQADYPTAWNANHAGHLYWSKTASVAYAESYSDPSAATGDKFFCSEDTPLTVEGTEGLFALSNDEWSYLLNTRTVNGGTGEGKSCQRATVNSVYGLIIYPDGYTTQTAATTYTAAQWASMESDGCVFLPAAGGRDGSSLSSGGSIGYYWSATPNGSCENFADFLYFNASNVKPLFNSYGNGYSIRLVKDCTPTYKEGSYTGKGINVGGTWWAPVNCGYDADHLCGKLYQWGRMDGCGYNDGTSTVTVPAQDASDKVIQTAEAATWPDGGYTLSPAYDKFYTSSSNPKDWYTSSKNSQLSKWPMNASEAPSGSSRIGNPCPTGWRVPTSDELGNLVYSDWDPSQQKGTSSRAYSFAGGYGTIFGLTLPAAGCCNYTNGSSSVDRGGFGYYWSSSVTNVYARYLFFRSSSASMKTDYRVSGYSVRCVLDDPQGSPTQQYGGGSAEEWF